MRCRPWRWLLGLIPLAAIAALVLIHERPRIEADLISRTQAALNAENLGWAQPAFEGRDGTIQGDAEDPSEHEQAVEIASSIGGVRIVDGVSGLKPSANRWSARLEDGRIKLRGRVASENDMRTVVGLASASFPGTKIDNRLVISTAGSQPGHWITGIGFGLKQLGNLRKGVVMLNENALTVRGEAVDLSAYKSIKKALTSDLPEGIVLAAEEIIAPKVEPYRWSADYSGRQLEIDGYVTNAEQQKQLLATAKQRFDRVVLLDRSEIARGAPSGFGRAVSGALIELKQLQSGRVTIEDDLVTVTGIAASREEADALLARLRGNLAANFRLDDRIDVAQPVAPVAPVADRFSPYPFEIARNESELVLSGKVPDEATRTRILDLARRSHPGLRVVDDMRIGSGAPDQRDWIAGIDFALAQLADMTSGQAQFSDLELSLSGKASDGPAYDAIEGALRDRLPAGLRISDSAIERPVISPFTWSAAWRDGAIELDGYVPDERSRAAILDYLTRRQQGVQVIDRMQVAAGAPGRSVNWTKTAETGLRALSLLGGGRAEMSDNRLRVEGIASDEGLPDRISRLIRTGLPGGFTGTSDVTFERPAEPDLTWRLVARSDRIEMNGEVPDESTRQALIDLAKREFRGREIVDRLRVVPGISDRWTRAAQTGLRLVGRLGEGEANLLGQVLTVRGTTTDSDIADVVRQTLSGGALPEGYSGVDRVSLEQLPPVMSPYRLVATIAGSEVVLSGFVPDEAARASLVQAAEQRFGNLRVIDRLQLARGLPNDRDGWLKTLEIGFDRLAAEGNGRAELIDRQLTIYGDTEDAEWRNGSTVAILRRELPRGFSGEVLLDYQALPRADWDARLADGELVLSGDVPRAVADSLLQSARRSLRNVRVIDEMQRVDASPKDWLAATQAALQTLGGLYEGSASLRETTMRVDGLATSQRARVQALLALRRSLPSDYRGEPQIEVRPQLQVIRPYAFGAYSGGRSVRLTGFVPDDGVKRDLEDLAARLFPGADVSNSLAIGGGAPDRFADTARIALEQLAELRDGTVTISDLSARIRGRADSDDIRDRVRDVFARGLPGAFGGRDDIDVIAARVTVPVAPPSADTTPPATGGSDSATATTSQPAVPLRNRYRTARKLPEVNVEQELASTRPVDPDVCQVLLDSLLNRGEIRFRTSSARLEPDSFATLVRLTHVAGRCPDAEIEIAGHTDSDGAENFNQRLSERRAAAVVSYLVNSGLARNRLKSIGFGEARPIAPNDTPENKALNRRIEFEVLLR